MLLRMQRYSFNLRFRAGKELIIADSLLRAYIPRGKELIFTEEIAILQSCDAEQTAEIRMITSPQTLKLITESAKDTNYILLKEQILNGWPQDTRQLPDAIKTYSTFADELSVCRDLIYKADRLVVPAPARPEILNRLHSSHIGLNSTLRRARELVYWPGMCSDIRQRLERCHVCNRFRDAIQKEPLISTPPPSRPWERIACDIFTFDQKDYLVCVDHFSNFFEIDRLPSKAVSNIVYCLRLQFSRHGIPSYVHSDNSPFNSMEFKQFADKYEFEHVTSSPHYSQSNGKAENAVRTIKKLMKKAKEDNSDIFLALLEWRNSPSENLTLSPVQILMGRRTKSKLPISNKLLATPSTAKVKQAIQKSRDRQSFYYNRTAKERRRKLEKAQTVRAKYHPREDQWRKGEITDVLPYRSFNIRFDDGSIKRRSSKHIHFSSEPPIVFHEENDLQLPNSLERGEESRPHLPYNLQESEQRPPADPPSTAAHASLRPKALLSDSIQKPFSEPTMNTAKGISEPYTTRSGRIVKRPCRYE